MRNSSRSIVLAVLLSFLLGVSAFSQAGQVPVQNENSMKLSGGAVLGYHGGAGLHLYGTVSNLAQGFPVDLRLGAGYTRRAPGNSEEARRIFINNATNGVPETRGWTWDFRMDFLYPVDILSLEKAFVFVGPRYTSFVGNFKYVGGNEDFDVKSSQWGLGFGIESHFPMSSRVNLVLTGGYDYYPKSTLTGHDTSYSPDGVSVNEREEYTYSDADEAIKQPRHEIRTMIGVSLSL